MVLFVHSADEISQPIFVENSASYKQTFLDELDWSSSCHAFAVLIRAKPGTAVRLLDDSVVLQNTESVTHAFPKVNQELMVHET